MKKIFSLIISLFISISFADEFVDSGSTLGGYGELHWNTEKQEMDFHRFVLFYGHTWDENWSFKSEIELEHNMVGGSESDTDGDDNIEYDGELELEQAYINYHSGSWGFKGGVLLASVGIINPYHEPPTFLSVERPSYAIDIIPTTWFGNGFSFYGNIGDIGLEFMMLEDLNGKKILDSGSIRDGRNKGHDASATDLLGTKIISVSWTGIDGLRIGGSYAMNDAPVIIDDSGEAMDILSVTLMEINTIYSKNNIHTTFEYGTSDFSHTTASWTNSGYYLDIGYNLGGILGIDSVLMPWIRTSSYSINNTDTDIILYGLTYKPIPNISFKVDMGTNKIGNAENNILNIGLGYMF